MHHNLSSGSFVLSIETSNPSIGGLANHQPGFPCGCGVALGQITDMGRVDLVDSVIFGPARHRNEVDRQRSGSVSDRHDDLLMPAIASMCARAGVSPSELSLVGVSVGPGGYTGLRIAITIAKMLCWLNKAICVPVPTPLSVVASTGAMHELPESVAVALASKNARTSKFGAEPASAHITTVSRSMTIFDAKVFLADTLDQLATVTLIADSHFPDVMRVRATELGMTLVEPALGPVAMLSLVMDLPPVSPELLVPMYGRDPDAVTQWRAKLDHEARSDI